jgi:hypothetical protein
MLAGKPAGNACWNISICPERAALYILVARAIASGGKLFPFDVILSKVCIVNDITQAALDSLDNIVQREVHG